MESARTDEDGYDLAEDVEERIRRLKWISYYVRMGEEQMARDLGWDGMPFDPDAPIELGQRHAAGTVERKGHVNGKVREPGPSRVASAGPASPNGPDGTLDEVARATRFNSLLVGYSRPPDRSQRSRHCRDSSTTAKPAQEVPAARSIPLSATPSAPVGPTGALVGYSKSPQRTEQQRVGAHGCNRRRRAQLRPLQRPNVHVRLLLGVHASPRTPNCPELHQG